MSDDEGLSTPTKSFVAVKTQITTVSTVVEAEPTEAAEPEEQQDDDVEITPTRSNAKGKGPAETNGKAAEEDTAENGKAENGDAAEEDEDEDEEEAEEYEVEAILNHRKARGTTKYLVKWVGYDSDSNTWEPEDNVKGGAESLIAEYWANKKGGSTPKVTPKGRKRKETASDSPKRSTKKSKTDSIEIDADEESHDEADEGDEEMEGNTDLLYEPESKLDQDILSADNWEDLVAEIDTVEGSNEALGGLVVFVAWKNGKRSMHTADTIHHKCPLKVGLGL
ncbi:hypothetical protein HDV00_002033 [Rhizophlyctis rosea]|nr:hypothetical protein HDV00_002033 [Rhizophlyctis rosea]